MPFRGQHGSPGSFGNGKVKRQAYAAGRLRSYVHVMYVYTSGRLWASRSGSPANDQHWWGGRLQSCTPPSFIHSFPLDPFCHENSLFSFISFSHTFLSRPNSLHSLALHRQECCILRVGFCMCYMCEWVERKQKRQRRFMWNVNHATFPQFQYVFRPWIGWLMSLMPQHAC